MFSMRFGVCRFLLGGFNMKALRTSLIRHVGERRYDCRFCSQFLHSTELPHIYQSKTASKERGSEPRTST
jgi:hypothetical protein